MFTEESEFRQPQEEKEETEMCEIRVNRDKGTVEEREGHKNNSTSMVSGHTMKEWRQ